MRLVKRSMRTGTLRTALRRVIVPRGAPVLAVAMACGLALGGSQATGAPVIQFPFTGGVQSYVVPSGIECLAIDAFGAAGGQGEPNAGGPAPGGRGGRVGATIEVIAGEVLKVFVGGRGSTPQGGFNGGGAGGNAAEQDGGGGGGGTDIRRAPYGLSDRLVVAGGGGGGGADPDPVVGTGGAGGGLIGGDGMPGEGTPGGRGGTQTQGGAAPRQFDGTATDGALGNGGRGGVGPSNDDGGGGGGGGYFGGGGGAGEDDDVPSDSGGGGGGGSGFGPGDGTFESGVRSGNGLVELSPTECPFFDWSVPRRFGLDDDGDGMIDYFRPDGFLEIVPGDGWQVDLDVDADECDASRTYRWFVDGNEVKAGDKRIVFYEPHACRLSYLFPEERSYVVHLDVLDGGGNLLKDTERKVLVQDWLIVSLGDSVASGEGNPDIPGPVALWQKRQCHRSAWAGPARAAIGVEEADAKTSVTFVHLACSGATITEGLIGPYAGQEPGAPLNPQVVDMDTLTAGREIDAVLISIGANDVKFSTIVETCFIDWSCHAVDIKPSPLSGFGVPGFGSGKLLFEQQFAQLPGRYDLLAGGLGGTQSEPERIYITEYFDPTRDDSGSICDGTILKEGGSPLASSPTEISAEEARWASEEMMTALNFEVAGSAKRHGWTYIGSIFGSFKTHGYCAEDRWIVQISESIANQQNKDGTIHPNRPGHARYGDRIATLLTKDLYVGGDLSKPRQPE